MTATKFWIAAIMGLIAFYQSATGITLGLDQSTVTATLSALTAGLVWLLPNKPKV